MARKTTTEMLKVIKEQQETLQKKKEIGGTLLQSKYRQFIEAPDDYSDMYFSKEETNFIRRRLSHLSTGATAAIPLLCLGADRCPFSANCPFAMIGKTPEGKICLVEQNLLKEWVLSLIAEYEVDVGSVTDRFFVQELAEIELLLYRINSNLAQPDYAEMVRESYANVDRQGNIIYEEKIIPLMELKLKLQNRRDRLVKHMIGDRRGKKEVQAMLKEKDGGDVSTRGAGLRKELERLQRETKKLSDKLSVGGGKIIDIMEDELPEESKEENKEKDKEEEQQGIRRTDLFSAVEDLGDDEG